MESGRGGGGGWLASAVGIYTDMVRWLWSFTRNDTVNTRTPIPLYVYMHNAFTAHVDISFWRICT